MVPWLLQHRGVPLEDAAAEFRVSIEQVVEDLELLFVCGTPGGMPDDLIEADWEDGRVFIGNADVLARPLRLSVDEALEAARDSGARRVLLTHRPAELSIPADAALFVMIAEFTANKRHADVVRGSRADAGRGIRRRPSCAGPPPRAASP